MTPGSGKGKRARTGQRRRVSRLPPLLDDSSDLLDHEDDDDDERLQRQIDRTSRLLPRGGSGAPSLGAKLPPLIRPSPSDDSSPILPLVLSGRRPPGAGPFDPGAADLDPRVLVALLGGPSELDASFTSITRPVDTSTYPNGSYLDPSTQAADTLFAMSKDRFKLPAVRLINAKPAMRPTRGRGSRRRLQRYLAAYSYCPLYVRWRDLGRRFWPRWIREGSCRDPASGGGNGRRIRERSCSIPAGMTCQPSGSTTKTILWWHCRATGHRRQRAGTGGGGAGGGSGAASTGRNAGSGRAAVVVGSDGGPASGVAGLVVDSICGWIPIKYPVITDCQCTC